MRSHLTRAVFRQIIENELCSGTRSWSRVSAHQCLRTRRAQTLPAISRRSFFGFSRQPRRQPKPVDYATGHEAMAELGNRLKMGIRPQPPEELARAFVAFFRSRQKTKRSSSPLDDIQGGHALLTLEHLQKTNVDDDSMAALLGDEDLTTALNVLEPPPSGWDSDLKMHNRLARAIFEEIQKRQASCADDQKHWSGQLEDLLAFIRIMSISGDALYARETIEYYWDGCLEYAPKSPWPFVFRGLIAENKVSEVDKTVDIMQKRGAPFDRTAHQTIVNTFATRNQDLEMTKKWYNCSIASDFILSPRVDCYVLKLCIEKNEMDWGDSIFKSLLERHPGSKMVWNIIFQWSAAKGKSVDEIERMMHIMSRRSEGEAPLQPDIETINGLIELANSRGDPYTAERYVALGQKWGLQPNVQTHLLQLDYRIKVGDLGGARTAYAHLQGQEVTDDEDLPLVNKLIVALSAEKPQNYDAIMGLVEDLSERKARFEPPTVAALCSIHLQRGEIDDLVDLLNTHAFHYGLDQRAVISKILLTHCLNPATSTSEAWDTYNILRKTFAEIDIPTRTSLMNNFFTRNRSDMATHVFGHMRQQQVKSLRPTNSTYAQCLSGLSRAGDRKSLEIVHNMIKLDSEIEPNTQLYNALMLAYTGCGDPHTALGFWEDILHSREGPSYASIQIAFRACETSIYGEQTARSIWAKLQRFEIEVTREIYAAYVGALAGRGLFDECTKLIDEAEEKVGYRPDALLLGTFFNATSGVEGRGRVKEWAWERYPAAYEALLKLGMVEVMRVDEEGVERGRATGFDIGGVGRDVEA